MTQQTATEEKKPSSIVLSTKELTKLPGYRLCWSQIKLMISNGVKFSDAEASALAAFAFLNKLNPTTGECWLLKPKDQEPMGCMVGIKGLRRKAQQELGKDHQFFVTYQDMQPDDDSIWFQVRATLRDTKTMERYLTMRQQAVTMLKECGSTDPQGEALAIVGPPPVWEGIGRFTRAEVNSYKDKNYHPHNRAEKRAEAEAIKKRFSFDYDFGEGEWEEMEATADVQGDYIDVEAIKDQDTEKKAPEAFLAGTSQTQMTDPNMELPAKKAMKLKDYQRPMIKESVKEVVQSKAKENEILGANLGPGTRKVISEAMNRLHAQAEEWILGFIFEGKSSLAMATLTGEQAEAVAHWFQTHMDGDEPKADLEVAIESKEIIDFMGRKAK